MTAVKELIKRYKELPGPPGLPLLGNLFQFRFDAMHQKLERWADVYGPLYRFRLGPKKLAVLSDVDAIKRIHRDRPDMFRRTRAVEACSREMKIAGVFSVEGDDWRRQRKIVAMALNSAHLRTFFPKLRTTSERLFGRWRLFAQQEAEIDLCQELMRLTVDVITQLAFGIDFNTIEKEGPVIQQNMDKVFPMLNRRVNAPFAYWRHFKLAKDRELDRALEHLEQQVDEIIKGVRRRMEAEPALFNHPTNFLEAIIAAKESEGVDFSDADIFANVCTLLLAGEDTTANTIAWTVNYFMEYPEYLAKAREETDRVLGNSYLAGEIDQLSELPFLEAFYNESMRLKPVAPLGAVEPLQDTEILGYQIPRGMVIMTLHRHVACQEENFYKGSTFDPERWLTTKNELSCSHDTTAFIPFGMGPRFCPGRNLALLQIKEVLSMLIKNFDFELCDQRLPVKEKLAFAMMPRNLNVRLRERV